MRKGRRLTSVRFERNELRSWPRSTTSAKANEAIPNRSINRYWSFPVPHDCTEAEVVTPGHSHDWIFAAGSSVESEEAGEFCLDVEISAPLVGLIVAYNGRLMPEKFG